MSDATATTQILRLYGTSAERRRRRQALWIYLIGALLLGGSLVYFGFRLGAEHRQRVADKAARAAMPTCFVPIEAIVR